MEKNFKNYKFIDKMDYVSKKKLKDCPFCDIELIKDTLIEESNEFLIVLNKYPFNPGHLLIIPRNHVEDIDDLTELEFINLFSLLKQFKNILKKIYQPHGFNVGLNLGESAGGSVEHLHVHVVPRYRTELNFLEVASGTRVIVEKLEDTLKKIKSELKSLNKK